jgi:hypothetical protein
MIWLFDLSSSAHKIILKSRMHYLTKSNDTLLGTHTATFDHDEIVIDFTIMRETAHWSDGLVCQIVLGRSIIFYDLKHEK